MALQGPALGVCLSNLMQNMPQLQWLPALQENRTLRELNLGSCRIGDEGVGLIADALIGNTTMQVLDISCNDITSVGVADITRLIESTRLPSIDLEGNLLVCYDDNDANKHLITILHKNTTIQKLRIPRIQTVTTMICARNKSLAHVDLLLTPPLTLQQHQHLPRPTGSTAVAAATTMWIKTCHKAITKFAAVPNNAGASAIFKLSQARPALLEKRLKRPAAVVAAPAVPAPVAVRGPQNGGGGGSGSINNNTPANAESTSTINDRQKRKRL